MRLTRGGLLRLLVASLVGLAACVDEDEMQVLRLGPGEAARSLAPIAVVHSSRLDEGAVALNRSRATLSSSEALALASAAVRTFVPFHRSRLESERGRSIDLAQLRHEGPVWLVESSYHDPVGDVFTPLDNYLGPYALTTFSDGFGPAVAVAVALMAEGYAIEDGELRLPVQSGNLFQFGGIPIDGDTSYPQNPSAVATRVVSEFGVSIAAPLELVRGPQRHSPLLAKWRVHLERPVAVRDASGETRLVTQVFVGPGFDVWADSTDEVDVLAFDYLIGGTSRADREGGPSPESERRIRALATPRSGFPTRLVPLAMVSR